MAKNKTEESQKARSNDEQLNNLKLSITVVLCLAI